MDVRISIPDRAEVALEVADVDGVEADDGDEEADVGLSELVPDEEVFALEDALEAVERGEEREDGGLVGFLRRGEAGLVHAVWSIGTSLANQEREGDAWRESELRTVDGVVHPVVDLVYLLT